MQTQKEYIQSAILLAARQEFVEKGFSKASLRSIAAHADVTLSNIYNYFQDKDALFCALLSPYIKQIEAAKQQLEAMEAGHDTADEKDHLEMLEVPVKYVYQNREMFKLLFFGAEGSSLAGFQNHLIKWFGEVMRETQEGISKRHNISEELASDSLLVHIGSIWVNFIHASLKNDLEPEAILKNARELMRFVYHGWIGFLGVKPEA